jgi:peptidoglycan/xylan/chitin deacetylase (PgdA/CDA1 family)
MNFFGGAESKLSILMYHRIGTPEFGERSLYVSEDNFERQVEYLLRRYRVLSFEDAVELLARGDLPRGNSVVLTFDDGYRDNYEKAFPILRKHGCPATIFVATEPLESGQALWPARLYYWCAATKALEFRLRVDGSDGAPPVLPLTTEQQRRRAFYAIKSLLIRRHPRDHDAVMREIAEGLRFDAHDDPFHKASMLTWDQLREMSAAGIGIGSHTMTHPSLPMLTSEECARELAQSKEIIERKLNCSVTLFAYPFGGRRDFNPELEALVKQSGYKAACSALRGVNRPDANRFALRRVYVRNEPLPVFALRLLACGQEWLSQR